jgi:hypothetical protein
MKTHLDIWAPGPMVPRFVLGGHKPGHTGDATDGVSLRRAPRGVGVRPASDATIGS